jgi:hypothetical protein
MCMFGSSSTPAAPVLPPEPAQMKQPDATATTAAGRRTEDRIRSGTNTILTSPSGVDTSAPTDKKTLLGQ